MAKKLKKKKTGMNPKVKFTLTHAFKGVISNQSVIDGSKESPWWVAAIFFVFSVIIPLLPNFVKIANSNGGSFINSVNYGFDDGITALAYDMHAQGYDLKAKNGLLHFYEQESENPSKFINPSDNPTYFEVPTEEYAYTVNANSGTQYALRVFFWTKDLSSSKLSKYVNTVAKQKFKIGTTEFPDLEPIDGQKYYTPNIMVITPETLAVALYKSNGTKQMATSLGGLDWKSFSTKVGLFEYLNKEGIKTGEIDTLDRNGYINEYRAGVMKRMIRVFNNTYLNQRTKTLWSNTGIYAGIYAGIILFLGLMIFILTRGKANPFKYLNIWHCQKIAWWASFTPALLGMILAFIFSGNMIGQMAFILLVSLRVMWLSMKQLRPVYQQ